MTRRKLILIVLVILAGLGGAVWMLGPIEPRYGGKRLSVWLDDQRFVDEGRIELTDESVRAVRAIGSNAIPCLLAMLRCSDSQAKLRLAMALGRYPSLQERIPIGATKRRQAVYGFRALGLEARPAIPEIVNLGLTSSDGGTRSDAINALTSAHEEAIALIAQALTSRDREVRVRAAFALGCLRQAPDVSLPALTKALSDPDAEVRAMAVGSLGPYRDHARPMVSQITGLLTDTNARVRTCATEALAMIQPKLVPQSR
jgi:hypothetical protein